MSTESGGVGAALWKGAAGAVGAAMVVWLMGWLSPIWDFVVQAARLGWRHAMAHSQWPNWSAYLLSLLAAMSLLNWALRAWRSSKDNHSRFTQLKEGGDVLWSWRSISSTPVGLVPYCQTCSTQLVFSYDDGEGLYSGDQRHTELICQRCNRDRVLLREPGNYQDLVKRIKREIDRLVRTGEWRKHVPDSLPK